VRAHLEIDPLRAWYYCIFSNFCTLVILLQVNLAFGDEFEIVYEGYNFIFAWSLIPSFGHYRWLRSPIC